MEAWRWRTFFCGKTLVGELGITVKILWISALPAMAGPWSWGLAPALQAS